MSLGGKIDIRFGNGFDVHALTVGDGVILCGVKIPCDFSLVGHSDADVVLHSLTDALLGGAVNGDIGEHFPPTNPQWQGACSDIFVKKAIEIIKSKGGYVNHVDITIICEFPKITPYKMQMRQKLSNLLEMDVNRISIKATTTEQLGFCGRQEGIASYANAVVIY